MAKGSVSKEIIFTKMQEMFAGSFMADSKTLRIPMEEDGQIVEIKVTLTAAKNILGSAPAPAEIEPLKDKKGNEEITTLTPEEKARVEDMISALGGIIR